MCIITTQEYNQSTIKVDIKKREEKRREGKRREDTARTDHATYTREQGGLGREKNIWRRRLKKRHRDEREHFCEVVLKEVSNDAIMVVELGATPGH